MKVGVIHRISDPDGALSKGQTLFEPHEGVTLLQFIPSQDVTLATCIWESDSIDRVRELVDGALAETAEQTYFEVNGEQAVGLPQAAAAA
jgi:hypothetical protein